MDNSYPLIRTKVRTPPRPRRLLRRQRLVDFLHSNVHRKLILISAGAGYGKTSLLIDYAHDAVLPVCWYSLDANDGNVLSFVEYLAAAIQERFPAFGESILSALRAHEGPPEDVEPFVRLFIHELEENVSQYFVIIVDDYHVVTRSEAVNAFLDGVLRYSPDHVHFVLASRAIPSGLTLTRLVADGDVAGVGVEDLTFTTDEIRDVLAELGRTDLSSEEVQLLAERSEGWITAILLAAHATGLTQDVTKITASSGGLFQYLADEVLGRQPEAVQSFLLGSALLPELTPPLCDALLDISSSAQTLAGLTDGNLFTWPLDTAGTGTSTTSFSVSFWSPSYGAMIPCGFVGCRCTKGS